MKFIAFLLGLTALPAAADCAFETEPINSLRFSGPALERAATECAAAGFDFSAPLPSGDVPIHELVIAGISAEAVRIALEAGADPNATDKYGSPAAVDLINFSSAMKDDPEKLAILRLLGQAGADFSLPDSHGDTALARAAGGGEIEVTRILLEYGADPNGLNTYDRTPLFATVFGRCSPEIGELIIEAGGHYETMPMDQIERMFAEAEKSCPAVPGGSDYIARLYSLAAG